jgi:hypothetical protein
MELKFFYLEAVPKANQFPAKGKAKKEFSLKQEPDLIRPKNILKMAAAGS